MRIRAKLNFLVFSLVFGFGLAVSSLFYFARVADSLRGLQLQSVVVGRDLFNLTDRTKGLIMTEQALSSMVGDWDAALQTFESSLDAFQRHKGTVWLGADVRGNLEQAVNLWHLMRAQFDKAREGVQAIMTSTELEDREKIGLGRIGQMLQNPNRARSELAYTLLTTQKSLLQLDISARQFMMENLTSLSESVDEEVVRMNRVSTIATLLLSFLIMAGGTVLILLFNRSFARRLGNIERAMGRISERNLTTRSEDSGHDEIGALSMHTNSMLDILREFFKDVRSAAENVESLKDSLSAGTTQSASALDEISRNIESIRDQLVGLDQHISASFSSVTSILEKLQQLTGEIGGQSTSIAQSSASIEEMNASIESVTRLSEERRSRVSYLLEVIGEGGDRVAGTNDMIAAVSRDIDDVLEVIEIIDAVSEQTNILSMNAAIESAHAGEAGRGFAVVAEEIRKLAESTSENASSIGISLKSVTEKIRQALSLSVSSRESFTSINAEVRTFAGALDEIARAMTELAGGSREILKTTALISEVTLRIRNAAQEMNGRTNEIQSAMRDSQAISATVVSGMNEIEYGSKEILTTLVDISKMAEENRQRMDKLRETVDTFVLDAKE